MPKAYRRERKKDEKGQRKDKWWQPPNLGRTNGGSHQIWVPFDRMLVAQAKTEPLLLLTNDALLAGYGDCIELVSPRPRRG